MRCVAMGSVVLAVLLPTACGPKDVIEHQHPPVVMVRVDPPDLAASTRGAPLRVLVGLTGAEVTDSTLASVAARLSIVDAAGAEVARQVAMGPPGEALPYSRYFDVSPIAALASEWHRVRIDLRGTAIEAWPTLIEVGDGQFVSRFHPDSDPVVRSVQLCRPFGPSEGEVTVALSEPVGLPPSAAGDDGAVPLAARLGDIDCPLRTSVGSDPDSYAATFVFACEGIDPSADTLTLSLLSPMAAASGKQAALLVDARAQTAVELALDDAYVIADCAAWNMP